MRRLLCLASLLAFAAACRHDPVAQEQIDALGPESGTPSATHRPGQPCVVCHDTYGGAQPAMAIGGTVYALDTKAKKITPVKNVRVLITDSSDNGGVVKKACTNEAGNFWIERANWADIVYPLSAKVGSASMQSLIGREGSCASCHQLPGDDSLVPLTGASQDSAGVIYVDAMDTDPTCEASK